MADEDFVERWINAMPEGKLELIDGQLIISTLAGSRRIAWELLRDYGPPLGLKHAPAALWWAALAEAYRPTPLPTTPAQWWAWAGTIAHEAEPPGAGPHVTGEHRRVFELLSRGLHHFTGMTGQGTALGRDFVVRLGEDGLTPDQLFIDRPRLAHLHNRYLDGPPAFVVEISQPGSEEQDRQRKKELYERSRVFEYWLLDPFARRAEFFRLDAVGQYQAVAPDDQGVFHSAAVLGLSLSLVDLWQMSDHTRTTSWAPFLPTDLRQEADSRRLKQRDNDLDWDTIPFVPRVDLGPQAIRFEEFASWCGRAKFESYGHGLVIGGHEATRRVFGMLMMTFGLVELVRLASPREWIAFLVPEVLQPQAEEQCAALLQRASYSTRDGIHYDVLHVGKVPGLAKVTAYAETEDECRSDLAASVRDWVLLRLARSEPAGVE